MKITIWGNQYPLRLDTRNLHLSFPGIETMERNKEKETDLRSLSFYINDFFFWIKVEYTEYGFKVFPVPPDNLDVYDLQFLFDNFEKAEKFTLFLRDRSVIKADNYWKDGEMEFIKAS
jgi:hypothetical protein